jgi:AAA domain
MSLQLLDAQTRLNEPRGPKILICGPAAVGKTSLLRTVSPEALATTLLIDLEAGDLPITNLPLASIRPRTWPDLRDIAVAIGGPDPGRASGAYSQGHHESVVTDPDLASLARFNIVFVDSFTDLSRRCRAWSEQQPEALNQYGKKDTRGVYGLVARELLGWTQQIQHARSRTIILVAILERISDDYGVSSWRIQLEGQRTGRELPAILDEIITMTWIATTSGKSIRAFICDPHNAWGYPTKDRSGKLDPIEEPHLGKLLAKLAIRQPTRGE